MMTFDLERVQKRVKAMSEGELLTWLGAAIPGMQRHLEAYERSHNGDHLGELAIAEMTASVVIQELVERKFRVQEASVASAVPSQPDTLSAPKRSKMRLGRRGRSGDAPAQTGATSE